MPAAARNLMTFLTTPSKIASKLDWHVSRAAGSHRAGAVLSVDIGRDRMGLAVAPHPSTQQPIQALKAIALQKECQGNRHVLTNTCVTELAQVVKQHQVCALVVSWPVQDDGRCGKPCGQVLHTLDSLIQQDSDNAIIGKNRPVCLWDDHHVVPSECDSWGRDPSYGNCTVDSNKTIHRASQEQYEHHDCSSAVAAQVWQDFCQTHWPEEVEEQPSRCQSVVDCSHEDAIEDDDDKAAEARIQAHMDRALSRDVEAEEEPTLNVAFA